MYASKKKPVKKYLVGGALAIPAIAQGVMGLGQSIFGMSQAKKAKEAIKEIQKNAPNIRIPTAIRQLADEPIAEEFMEAQELGAQRRTATAIDALGRGGSRSLGILPSVMEQERVGEQQRAGQYEQMRKSALSALGQAQDTKLAREMDQYAREIDAARMSQMAGQQNIFGGLGQIGRGVTAFDWSKGDWDMSSKKSGDGSLTSEDYLRAAMMSDEYLKPAGAKINPITGEMEFKKGGMLPKYQDGGTLLSKDKEKKFQDWLKSNKNVLAWKEEFKKKYGEYPSIDNSNYDYRGAWEAGIEPQPTFEPETGDTTYHWGSIGLDGKDLKSKDHPTRWKSDFMKITGVNPDEKASKTSKSPFEILPKYKMGGDMPIKTEGEFNHNTNPKALIDEKTGEKQAELTGDEVILNKDQYKKMQKLAEEGKAEELLAYYKKLSAKFEKEKA